MSNQLASCLLCDKSQRLCSMSINCRYVEMYSCCSGIERMVFIWYQDLIVRVLSSWQEYVEDRDEKTRWVATNLSYFGQHARFPRKRRQVEAESKSIRNVRLERLVNHHGYV